MIIFLIIFAANKGFIMRRKKKREIFRVILPCKGYVKEYLTTNYGRKDDTWNDLVDFTADRELHDYFIALLKRCEEKNDNKIKGTQYLYRVSVAITYDQFQRYGWLLSMTDTLRLNSMLERRVKGILYSYVGALRSVGLPLSECIRRFRVRTGISEWLWDTDTIRRDLNRNMHVDTHASDIFLRKIGENVWRSLSQVRTITQEGFKTYIENEEIDL